MTETILILGGYMLIWVVWVDLGRFTDIWVVWVISLFSNTPSKVLKTPPNFSTAVGIDSNLVPFKQQSHWHIVSRDCRDSSSSRVPQIIVFLYFFPIAGAFISLIRGLQRKFTNFSLSVLGELRCGDVITFSPRVLLKREITQNHPKSHKTTHISVNRPQTT